VGMTNQEAIRILNEQRNKFMDEWVDFGGVNEAYDMAITLLKEQESVVPKYNARTNWYECGDCHYSMTSGMHCKGELIPAYKVGFCAKCGKAVRWK